MIDQYDYKGEVRMQNYARWGRKILLVLGVLLVLFTINQGKDEVWAAATPELKTTKTTLYIGYNTHVIGVNNLSKSATVTYSTSNKKVALVSKKGKVTPVATGTAKITVTIKHNKKTYKKYLYVTVKKPYIDITKQANEVVMEDSFQFQAKVYGSKSKVKWSVSNKELASINPSTGELTGLSSGTVTVTATAGSLKSSCKVKILAPTMDQLVISGEDGMIVGETFTYTISNDPYMADWWYVSDDNIAYLGDGNGIRQEITALKAGTFKISAETSDGYGEKTVKVNDLQIIGNPNTTIAGTTTFSVNSKQVQKNSDWFIEDEEIAEIYNETDEEIIVRGLKAGRTQLRLCYNTPESIYEMTTTIYVGEAADFKISGKTRINVHTEESYSVNLPGDADMEWTISNPSKATIREDGNRVTLYAEEKGTYYLTVSIGSKRAVLEIKVEGEEVIETPDTDIGDSSGSGNQNGNSNTGGNSGNTSGTGKRVTMNGVIYELGDAFASVVGAESGTKNAVILSEVEGLPVTIVRTGFGQCATLKTVTWSGDTIALEMDCFYNNKSLTSISLQGKSISIGLRALANCISLKSITLTGEVASLGAMAFAGCTALTEITIPGTQTVYESGGHIAAYGPFYGCSNLRVLRLESKVIHYNEYTKQNLFYGIKGDGQDCKIEELYLNMEEIDSNHILKYIYKNVRKVTLVNTTTICSGAFSGFENLREVNIPASTVDIEDFAFTECYNLTTVNAEINRARTFSVGSAFQNTRFAGIAECYLNGAENLLGMEDYSTLQKALSVINNLKATAVNDYDIIKGAHDWVVRNTNYDHMNYVEGTIPDTSFMERAVFEYGTAVCEGYAKAFGLLMKLAGIECHYVTGLAYNGLYSFGIGHAWNIVKLDGSYYHIDTTWDDPSWDEDRIRYDYFLISDAQMSLDHEWQYDYTNYPICPADYNK